MKNRRNSRFSLLTLSALNAGCGLITMEVVPAAD